MKRMFLFGFLFISACSSSKGSITSPSQVEQKPQVIQYAINIPDVNTFRNLISLYPNGISIPPIQAQVNWNYNSWYGANNVYYGPLAPTIGEYKNIGIVVASESDANSMLFYKNNTATTWLGLFVFAPIR